MEEFLRRKRVTGDVKKRILEAAVKVFSECGYERATTRAIAAEAGIAEGTIFNHFRTKKDILLNFLEEEIVGPLPDVFGDTSASDMDILKSFLRNRFDIWRKSGGMLKVILAEALFDPQMAGDFRERVFRPGIELISRYVAQRMDEGTFRKMDPRIVARSLVAYVIGFGLMEQVGVTAPEVSDEEIIDTLTTIFLGGVAKGG